MTTAAMMAAMRMGSVLLGVAACVVAAAVSPAARAMAVAPRPAYAWALDATLVVAGRVESVDAGKGTLRITKTLAGRTDAGTIEFAPASHPECMSALGDQPIPADVTVGDDVALFLVKGKGASFEVLDHGYAKVGIGEFGPHSVMDRAPLAIVERLVTIMKTADLDARDRAMIAAATADDQFLRRAACRYVEHDLGLASPPDRDRAGRDAIAAADDVHHAAVRRLGKELASLVRRENGSEPCGAAIRALAAASCAPDGAFDDIARFARAIARIDWWQADPACRVLALYDRPEAVTWIALVSNDQARLLATLGGSRRPEARSLLLEEFGGADFDRVVAAANGLGALLARGRDVEVEDVLLARLKEAVGPTLEEALGAALMTSRPLGAANVILDKLASPSSSKAGEDAGAKLLRAYLGATPPIVGVRELLTLRQNVLTKRLDAGKTESVWPLYLLQQLGTPEAMASLRRAAESHPDADMRREAKWRSEPLGK